MSDDKPTLEELRHHGVMGMKWGKRKAPGLTGAQIRKARRSVEDKAANIQDAKREVRRTTKRGSAERAAGKQKISDMKLALLKDPDRVTAQRLTRGEKAIFTVFALTGAGAAPIVVGLGTNKLVTDHIEKKQARGGYDKKN